MGESIGSSELGLRSLSAVWGVLAVVLDWLIGRRLFGSLAATLAALLLAVAPLAVYYSQEVRMYTQVTASVCSPSTPTPRATTGCTRWRASPRCTRSTSA